MDNKDEFLHAIRIGMDIESACYLIGGSPMAIYRLLERGKREQERLSSGSKAVKPKASEVAPLELWQAVTKARSEGQRELIQAVRQAVPENWKAGEFLLGKINPSVFGSGGSVKEIEAEPLGEIEAW